MPERDDYWLIDPPVGPFSPLDELRAWRQELLQMPPSDQRDEAVAEVDEWIQQREKSE